MSATASTVPESKSLRVLLYVSPALLLPLLAQVDYPWPADRPSMWAIDLTARVVVPALVLWLLARNLGIKPKDYGLNFSVGKLGPAQFAAASFLCFVAYMGYVVVHAIGQLWLDAPTYKPGPLRNTLVAVLYFSLAASFFEEAIYRGVLGAALLSTPTVTARLAYIIVSTTLFSAAHAPYGAAMVVACIYVGVLTAGLYIWLRNLWLLIAAHFATDLFVGIWALHHAAPRLQL